MKKSLVLLLAIITFVSCKNDKKVTTTTETQTTTTEAQKLFEGDFVYYADAAVIQTNNDVYGVIINEKMHELNKKAEPFKAEPTDMVRVEVRGILVPKAKNEEGWPFKLDIKEIINVRKLDKDNNVVKLGS